MRLFIAITFSPDFKNHFIDLKHQLRQRGVEGNFTLDENLHLTLCFIGETQQVDQIKSALKRVNFQPFVLSVSEVQNFRDMIWVGIKKNQALSELSKSIKIELDKAGIDYDRKPFKAHITLARKVAGDVPKLEFPDAKMNVEKISLMKSARENGKLVYTEIFSAPQI